jgi:hypothetical protein
MTAANSLCIHCGHSMKLHTNGICHTQRCKCKTPGFTPAQVKVLEQK